MDHQLKNTEMLFQVKLPASITQTLVDLKSRGYRLRFRREATCIYCFELKAEINVEEFEVDQTYYFQDVINPDGDRVLYAISLWNGDKGFLIDACNAYADNISDDMERKLQWSYPLY